MTKLQQQLNITPGLTAIIGGGGKTTLMEALARELSRDYPVIMTTSTKIFPPDWCPCILPENAEELSSYENRLRAALRESNLVATGSGPNESGKLSEPPLSFERLTELAPFVLVEADGSKHHPLKGHGQQEPVIPPCAVQTIYVVGLSGVGKPIREACHRPELYLSLLTSFPKATEDTILTPEMIAEALQAENLGDRYLLNQADTPEAILSGRQIQQLIHKPCIIGSFHTEVFQC